MNEKMDGMDDDTLNEHLNKRSISINQEMKETGVEAYYDKVKDKPRY